MMCAIAASDAGKIRLMPETGIVWLRSNLRLADNPPLFRAFGECGSVRVVFLLDPIELRKDAHGAAKWGARRLTFTIEALADIDEALRKKGNALEIIPGGIESLAKKAEEWGAKGIYYDGGVTPEEQLLEKELRQAIPTDVAIHSFWGHTLYHPDDIPFASNEIPPIFTQFRKDVEKKSLVRPPLPIPEISPLAGIGESRVPTLDELGFRPPNPDDRAVIRFKGGEESAEDRLQHYTWQSGAIKTYKLTRNELLGADYSSKFSPWLAIGCISPRAIYSEIKAYEATHGANESTYWLYFELLWRDYFWFVARQFGSRFFRRGGPRGMEPEISENAEWLAAWKTGVTGVPFVDANMIELNQTGFMSNRGRQNVASYLVKDLKQDWRKGAAYFEQQLIDYDVHSNWGNWAYVAGVGNDPRENRYFNVLSQAQRYDEDGAFVKHWLTQLRDVPTRWIHTPWLASVGIDKPIYIPHQWNVGS